MGFHLQYQEQQTHVGVKYMKNIVHIVVHLLYDVFGRKSLFETQSLNLPRWRKSDTFGLLFETGRDCLV